MKSVLPAALVGLVSGLLAALAVTSLDEGDERAPLDRSNEDRLDALEARLLALSSSSKPLRATSRCQRRGRTAVDGHRKAGA